MRNQAGFTLLETMIVILIVGILSAIAMATYVGVQNMGYDTDARSNIHNGATAARAYYTGHDSTYKGMNAEALAEEATGINFANGDMPSTPETIYVSGVDEETFVLKCKSESGKVFTAVGNHLTVTLDF